MFCQSYDPPEISMLFSKKIQKSKTAATTAATAATALVAVYDIKTA